MGNRSAMVNNYHKKIMEDGVLSLMHKHLHVTYQCWKENAHRQEVIRITGQNQASHLHTTAKLGGINSNKSHNSAT